MKKILITGGAGYIGSMLCTKLINFGYQVTVIDLLKYNKSSLNHLYFYKNFKLIVGDVRNKKLIKKLIKKNDFIIPLAGLVGAPLCDKYKKDAISTNLESIKTLRKIVTSKNKIIFLTSNSGYGIGEKNKFCTEESPLKPISLYGKTKCEAESEILKTKNYVCFRLATVFGQSYRMRTDLLVNNFVNTAIKKKKITLFEPHFRRNFIHVRDVVDAIIFTITHFNKLKSNVYNLGLSSANISKIMLAKKIQKQYKKLKIKIVTNRRDPDKRDYYVSNKKIEKKGFKAKIKLESGISELIQIFTNDKNKVINNY
jgi:nucleoside-diphosphate-sugar epimerase|tara:strand:- start:2159 stop:3094 length:936 start_codon:yes stop_codon:yes gene_type:complete